ncbi:MAG: RNA polymerase [Oenococcus sp.]|uniref:RNA polymerase n=1 Tax=Oenococcus TaxID=46254 RepID=UPI0021E9532B|nr:RNA polymerase [Oenococcus kitaharae]MCV3296713.1 RNA polymerase [Oenococcus kitaharae]
MFKRTSGKIIISILAVIVLVIAGFLLTRSLTITSNQDQKKQVGTSSSKSSQSQTQSSRESSAASSSSASSSTSSSSQTQQIQWQSLDLVHQIAILIQAAFPNQNAKPNNQFDFASNYWDMTGSINNGEIHRYVPNADSFAGISDILSAKIRIVNNQIQVTRPITAPFSVSIDQAMRNYYQQNDAISYTNNLSARVVTPARLAELQRK